MKNPKPIDEFIRENAKTYDEAIGAAKEITRQYIEYFAERVIEANGKNKTLVEMIYESRNQFDQVKKEILEQIK